MWSTQSSYSLLYTCIDLYSHTGLLKQNFVYIPHRAKNRPVPKLQTQIFCHYCFVRACSDSLSWGFVRVGRSQSQSLWATFCSIRISSYAVSYWVQHRPTIDQNKLYTELSRTFFNIFSSDFQGESTSVFYIQLCGRIFILVLKYILAGQC